MKKTIIKIIIGAVAAGIICIAVVLFIKSRRHDTIPDTLRLGMTEEEFISFCERNNYEYTHHRNSEEYKINNKVSLNKVEGTMSVYMQYGPDSIQREGNMIFFRVDMSQIDDDNVNEKLDLLNEFLYKRYGKPFQEKYTAMTYVKKGVCAVLIYSMDKNEIYIMWTYLNISIE